MVKTGYISFVVETGGGFDANNNPIVATKTPSVYFPCNLSTVKKHYVFIVDEQQKQAAYSMYIESDKISTIDVPSITEVKLQDNNTNELGTFQVLNVEYLNLTKQVKIIV